MRRPRFTVRRMMAFVAIVAVYLWAESTMGRGAFCQRMAQSHEESWRNLTRIASELEAGRWQPTSADPELYRFRAELEFAKSRAYLKARWQPWMSLPPEMRTCGLTPDRPRPSSIASILFWWVPPTLLLGWLIRVVCLRAPGVTDPR